MTPMDERILELLERSRSVKSGGLWFQTKGIAINLNANMKYVSARLQELAQHGYVDREDNMYRISEKGIDYILQ